MSNAQPNEPQPTLSKKASVFFANRAIDAHLVALRIRRARAQSQIRSYQNCLAALQNPKKDKQPASAQEEAYKKKKIELKRTIYEKELTLGTIRTSIIEEKISICRSKKRTVGFFRPLTERLGKIKRSIVVPFKRVPKPIEEQKKMPVEKKQPVQVPAAATKKAQDMDRSGSIKDLEKYRNERVKLKQKQVSLDEELETLQIKLQIEKNKKKKELLKQKIEKISKENTDHKVKIEQLSKDITLKSTAIKKKEENQNMSGGILSIFFGQ